ncbi:MAG: 50S ribosomal protein L9 [Leptospiraceae bacterium]|nr:50S ribosomal protein L9 [Leptospiraceae bacterium]MCB1303860.1 50S ribosomal protein L9 [Leptospiraceae bacterium]
MKVILQKDINGLGDAGEIKDVRDGYARNFLLPRKLVLPAFTGSARALEHQQRLLSLKTERRKKAMQELAGKMEAVQEVEISVMVGAKQKLFGSVTPLMVARALEEKGYSIDKRKVELPDSIRALGTYKARIKLAEGITVPLSVKVVPANEVEEEEYKTPAERAAEAAAAAAEEQTEAPAEAEETQED